MELGIIDRFFETSASIDVGFLKSFPCKDYSLRNLLYINCSQHCLQVIELFLFGPSLKMQYQLSLAFSFGSGINYW